MPGLQPVRKAVLFIAALAVVSGIIILLVSFAVDEKTQDERLTLSASFYPLAHFAGKAGGENVEVFMVTPPGVESHDFEPTPRDIRKIRKSAVFIYNGAGLDPWAERIAPTIEQTGVSTLEMTSHFTLLSAETDEAGENGGHEHDEGGHDPHIWLDPLMAAGQVKLISEALAAADPPNAAAYRSHYSQYSAELMALHEEFSSGLQNCGTRDMIVAHDAFRYLAARYGLNIIPVVGVFSGEEPSPRRIAEVTRIAKEKSIRYIFFEPLASRKIAHTIARETGADVLELNPLEGLTKEEEAAGKDYISVMRGNLANMRKALQCI
jgi:zinc transport system substrate-binding protein